MEIKTKAYAYLLVSMLIGSFTPVMLVYTKNTNLSEILFLAALASIPVGVMLVTHKGKRKELAALPHEGSKLFFTVFASLLIFVPYLYGIGYAEHFISASLSTVIFRLYPLLMLIFLPLLLRERLSKKQVVALSLGFAGVVIGLSGGNLLNILQNPNFGIVGFMVLMALGYALGNVVLKLKVVDSDVFVTVSGFVLAVFFGFMYLFSGAQATQLSPTSLLVIAYVAVTNIGSFYMYSQAIKKLKITLVTNVFTASTFLTFIWSYLLFNTSVEVYYLAIAALTLVGVYLQLTDRVGGSYLTRSGSRITHLLIFDVTGAFANTGEGVIRAAISTGGRVLALKLDGKHRPTIDEMVKNDYFQTVFTDRHMGISQEVRFVRDVLGAGEGEMVVMKAGDTREGESFFEELADRLEVVDVKQEVKVSE